MAGPARAANCGPCWIYLQHGAMYAIALIPDHGKPQMKQRILACCITICLSFFAAGSVYAEISKQQAANIAKSKYPGRVIDIKAGGNVYRVKVLDNNGGMHIVVIDKQNGSIKSSN